MKEMYDINDFVSVPTESKTTNDLVERFKKRRKELKLSQKELSNRSGVSYASIRRFEEALNYYLTYKDDKFFEWYDANFDVEGNYIYTSNFSSNEETANGNESTGGGGSGGGRF